MATRTQTQVLSSEIIHDIVSIKVKKLLISSNSCTRIKWISTTWKQKDNSVLKSRRFRMMEYDTSPEQDEFNGSQKQEFAIQTEEIIGALHQMTLKKLVKKSRDVNMCHVPWLTASKNEQSLLRQSKVIFKDSCVTSNWSAEIMSKGTMNSGASLLQKSIDCKIKNQSLLTCEARKRKCQCHQHVTLMQMNFETT